MIINVVIADDEELFRVGLVHILSRDPEINIVFQAGNGKELLEYLAKVEQLPDIDKNLGVLFMFIDCFR